MTEKSRQPYSLARGEGRAFWFGAMHRVEKADWSRTQGAFAVSEVTADAGYATPPHVHSREDEALYVLEGSIDVYFDGKAMSGGPGAWFFMPRGIPHSWIVGRDMPARLLIVVSPAGFERFYIEHGTPAEQGRPARPSLTREQVTHIMAEEYGITLTPPPPGYPVTNV